MIQNPCGAAPVWRLAGSTGPIERRRASGGSSTRRLSWLSNTSQCGHNRRRHSGPRPGLHVYVGVADGRRKASQPLWGIEDDKEDIQGTEGHGMRAQAPTDIRQR